MKNNVQLIALYTLIRHELTRMFRIHTQVFLPPVITTILYFLIFGAVMGKRIGPIQGIEYVAFIAPGLVMMAIISNAYSNVSSSLYSARFQKSIEEILVSPMHNSMLLLGYVCGGVLRGTIVALLVFIVSTFFTGTSLYHLPLTLLTILSVSVLLSLAGFTNGLLARRFDEIAIFPTFILTPLTYLGGVFYSLHMLSPFWQKASHLNPIFYMVNALRHAMVGHEEVNSMLCMLIILSLIILMTYINVLLLKKGAGLRG